MSSAAPQGFRRTAELRRFRPGRSSRDPGLTNCPPIRGNSCDYQVDEEDSGLESQSAVGANHRVGVTKLVTYS